MSPLSHGPCPQIIQKGNFIFCRIYKNRPKQCQNHTFHSRHCPVGLEKLKLQEPIDISRRIDDGWDLMKGGKKSRILTNTNKGGKDGRKKEE